MSMSEVYVGIRESFLLTHQNRMYFQALDGCSHPSNPSMLEDFEQFQNLLYRKYIPLYDRETF
jgi:hypothetical protein